MSDDQREAQLVDLVAGAPASARRARTANRSVSRSRSRQRRRDRAARAVARSRQPSPRATWRAGRCLADAHAGGIELAVDLQRLVVVGEAEIGHAALPPAVGLSSSSASSSPRGAHQQPAGQVVVGAVERIDEADDDRRRGRRPSSAAAVRCASRKSTHVEHEQAVGRRVERPLAAPPAAPPETGRRCARPAEDQPDQLGVEARQSTRPMRSDGAATIASSHSASASGSSWSRSQSAKSSTTWSCSAVARASRSSGVLGEPQLVQHVVELVARAARGPPPRVGRSASSASARRSRRAAPELGAERRQRDDVAGVGRSGRSGTIIRAVI